MNIIKTKAATLMIESAKGYGLSATPAATKKFFKCIESIPDELFEDFIYTLYRIAEKTGSDGFDY